MKEFIIRFTRRNGTQAETMWVYAETEKEAVAKLPERFRLIACYPAEWEAE
ncbi:MAG: hypothetical protein LBC76_08165 [Treponema sp.]|jgi:hypothetical protein|nr:hypothetical protein [Treponema sp.]